MTPALPWADTPELSRLGRSLALALSLLLHAAAAVAFSQLVLRVDQPERNQPEQVLIEVRWLSDMPPPPPPKAAMPQPTSPSPRIAAPTTPAVKTKPATIVTTLVSPASIADPQTLPSQPVASLANTPASVIEIPPAPPPAPRTEEAPVHSAQPDYAYNPKPDYPMALREQGIGGTVLLRVWADIDGRPGNIMILKSSGYRLLDDAALRAVRNWRFLPARRGAERLASWVEFPVRFAITD